jgi:protein-disulfide isomerase
MASIRAAAAARAAGMQGKFWAFHAYLLTCQPAGEPAGLLTHAYLRPAAKRIGRAQEGEPTLSLAPR